MTQDHEYEEFADRINGMINIDTVATRQDYMDAVSEILDKKPSVKQFAILWKSKDTQVRVDQQKLFKKAEGISLTKDKQQNARVIVSDVDKYKRLGASRSDLRGLDTKRVFGYVKIKNTYKRRMIDPNKTKVVKYPASYKRKIKGKVITVNVNIRERLFIYDKKGKRLRTSRPKKNKTR